jgi:nucleoside-diphosphate-sugar epimerase
MNNVAVTMKSSPRIVLLSGATGFIGSHLVPLLMRAGWETHIVSRANSRLPSIPEFSMIGNHIHDGSTEGMIDIVKDVKPSLVIHLASIFISQHEPGDVEELIKSNVLFGTQLLEAMRINNVKHLINTGTTWQHYEKKEYSPVNLYAATKQAFEALLQYYIESAGMQVITLKLTDSYGPDDPRPKLMNLLKLIAENMQPLAMSPGEQRIDIVHVDDVVRAYVLAAERLLSGAVEKHERYAVRSGLPLQLREFVRMIEHELGRELPIKWGARTYRVREVMDPWEGGLLPGWSAQVELEQGIRTLFLGQKLPIHSSKGLHND